MNRKILTCLLLLLVISGCANQNSSNTEIEDLNKKIHTLDSEVLELEAKNTSLVDEINVLKKSLDYNEYDKIISFKDVVKIQVKVIQKLEGDELYPYYIIVTQEDRDHNTPLLITVDNFNSYQKFNEGKTYELNVHVEAVIDRGNNVIRFMYLLHS